MGGYGSGRYFKHDTRITLDELTSLSVTEMARKQIFAIGSDTSGTISWNNSDSAISFIASTHDDQNLYLRLQYKLLSSNEFQDYTIRLSRTSMRFGGWRWWFHCPKTDHRVTRLYLVPEDGRFVSRHAYKLLYSSQTHGDFDRALAMRKKYKNQLGDFVYLKPFRMHQKTYDWLFERFRYYDAKVNEIAANKVSSS
jgi:hypothetical protein